MYDWSETKLYLILEKNVFVIDSKSLLSNENQAYGYVAVVFEVRLFKIGKEWVIYESRVQKSINCLHIQYVNGALRILIQEHIIPSNLQWIQFRMDNIFNWLALLHII